MHIKNSDQWRRGSSERVPSMSHFSEGLCGLGLPHTLTGLVATQLKSLARLSRETHILIMFIFAFFTLGQVKHLLHFLAT